jgi:glutaminase
MSQRTADLQAALHDVHRRCAGLGAGSLPDYIPELTKVDPALFAVACCTVDGAVQTVGDADHQFTMQSVSKPFVYAMALEALGLEAVHRRVGVEPTGYAFYSMIRLQEGTNKPHNPMVNAGAIAVTDLIRAVNPDDATERILACFARFAARDRMTIDDAVYRSERATGDRNRAIAYLMRHFRLIDGPVPDTLDLYFQHCAILASCRDLAVMAATLANAGRNPLTGDQVLDVGLGQYVLTVMFVNGLYDYSGRFAFEVGVPAKSAVSGAILAVVPGRMGLAVFSPPLDEGGNSVRGIATLEYLSERLGLHTFRSGGER